jgi:hypothetical protein
MSERTFAITSASPRISTDSSGKGQASFTVTNTTTRAMRCQAVLRPLGGMKAEWLSLAGDAERNFAPKETAQFIVNLIIPPEIPAAALQFRLDVCSTQNPDDDYTEGTVVAVEAARPAPTPSPSKKKFPWWIVLIILAVLALGAVVLTKILRKEPPSYFLIGEPERVTRAAKLMNDLGLKKIVTTDETGHRLPEGEPLLLPEPDQVAVYVVSALGNVRNQLNAATGSIHVLHKARIAVFVLDGATWSDQQRTETIKELGVILVHLYPNDPRTQSVPFVVDNDRALRKQLLSL